MKSRTQFTFLLLISLLALITFYAEGQVFHATGIKNFSSSDVITDLAMSSDGRYLAFSSQDGSLTVYQDFEEIWSHRGQPFSHRPLAFSPDNKYLVFSGPRLSSNFALLDLSKPKIIRTVKRHSYPIQVIQFSKDGKLLATAGQGKLIHLWKVNSNRLTLSQTIKGKLGEIAHLDFSADGQMIAVGHDQSIGVWRLSNRRTTRLIVPKLNICPIGEISVMPVPSKPKPTKLVRSLK